MRKEASLSLISSFWKENGCESIIKYFCKLWRSSTYTQTKCKLPICKNCKILAYTWEGIPCSSFCREDRNDAHSCLEIVLLHEWQILLKMWLESLIIISCFFWQLKHWSYSLTPAVSGLTFPLWRHESKSC